MGKHIRVEFRDNEWHWEAIREGRVVERGATYLEWLAEFQAGRALCRADPYASEPNRCPRCNSLHSGRGECRSCYREYLQPRGERSWED